MNIFSWIKTQRAPLPASVGNTAPAEMPDSSAVPPPPPLPRILWPVDVLILDNIERVEKVDIPLKEAERFFHRHSRLDLKFNFIPLNDAHEYTGPYGDFRFVLYWGALPQKWLNLIQARCKAAVAFYNLGNDPSGRRRLPGLAGATWALRDGVLVGGTRRIWTSIPTDDWLPYYHNIPFGGFDSWEAQIVVHELVNGVNGTGEARGFPSLVGRPDVQSYDFESDRLRSIRPEFYDSLGTGV